ncbi:osteopetrosis-associated transmembrane protein 1 [Euwallacea fornicatus]|uniref:osteopetrosis-associated transmembrane protein 1 n=1 Tax=Euwallacea fornicatus TaxID=995702 RepID=UPI00338DCB94
MLNKFSVSCYIWLITLILFFFPNVVPCQQETTLELDQGISPNCSIAQKAFSKASSEFIRCSIDYSKPIKFCENCVLQYIDIVDSYANMSKILNNGTACIKSFVNLDRLDIIQTLYENNVNLWNRAKCYECFKIINGTQTANISKETIMFINYYENYTDCVGNAKLTDVCSLCMDKYVQLQDYFFSISNGNDKIGVCMDIVDMMNNTWSYWGTTCCKYRRHKEYTFITSAVLVLVGTVLFYILAQVCAKKKLPTIMEQTRFIDTLET